MTPTGIAGLYDNLRKRIAIYDLSACADISLRLSSGSNEIEFYRLVFWGYALVNEAARIPLEFLMSLPPLRASNSLRQETSQLRTFLSHNLDKNDKRDRRTRAFVHRWFMDACGYGEPMDDSHYGDCYAYLTKRLQDALEGAIEACALFDDAEDGSRLLTALRDRISVAWPAHRFDRVLSVCASRLGNPDIDLRAFRARRLDGWRRVLSEAREQVREQALERRIEADLLTAIGETLPPRVRDNLERIAASPAATAAALLVLGEARRVGAMSLPQIIELVGSQSLAR